MTTGPQRANDRSRGADLLALNALVHALANSLDRPELIKRALTLLCNFCHQGAAAFIEVVAPEQQDNLSETMRAHAQPSPPNADHVHRLRLADQIASDRLLVCLRARAHRSWGELLLGVEPMVLSRRPEGDDFPGLEPLWHRFVEGRVFLIPVQGFSEPLGVLVIAELDASQLHALPFGAESLVAMAALLGSTLENARLFHKVSHAYQSVQLAQNQLIHAEKFAAVGLLSAQVAHEINNPASFVISNLSVMMDYVKTVSGFFDAFSARCSQEQRVMLEELMAQHEIAFLQEDLETLLTRSLAGMQRIHQIVQDLRYFSHDSGPELTWVDLEGLLDATLNLIQHELKYRAHIQRDYHKVPTVFSDANKLSQVFLNVLVNASQALSNGDMAQDFIRVETLSHPGYVLVVVEDSGEGILPEHVDRIFDPFFTTKRRGEGTGLGLSITRDILVSLGGDIRAFSTPGEGTRIEVWLPIRDEEVVKDERVFDSGSWNQPPELRTRKATPPLGNPGAKPDACCED